jgi:arginyl-tRNA synthetase
MIDTELTQHITNVLFELGIQDILVVLERPADLGHGDFATNVAMIAAKKAGKNPRALAEEIVTLMSRLSLDMVASIEVAGPGFINFKLLNSYFAKGLEDALVQGEKFGTNDVLVGKKVIVEYTDPNPFKEFHIGHLMSNTIGESISRIIEASGAETKRACYQGDVGMHVARTVWSMQEGETNQNLNFIKRPHNGTLQEKVKYLAQCYSLSIPPGELFENDSGVDIFRAIILRRNEASGELVEINKKIYSRTDAKINELYDWGREVSLEYFETIYQRLGTKFDYYFFESTTGEFGREVVLKNPEIFEKSEGAIVYKGDEAKGLHTRVFINKEGLPTYEAKELGLAQMKYDTYPYDTSIVITGNEVNDYFKVLLDAMSKVFPELAAKTEHYSHGMLRLPTGKMSSRTGDVITAASLIDDTKVRVSEKIKDSLFTPEEKEQITEAVAIGAIKYSILRQASGKDIIFDFEQSLSFEGDSGPYLQYAYARTRSLLAKAEGKKINVGAMPENVHPLHKYLLRFPEVVLRAEEEREPHYIATYLIELAREFSAFYANTIVLDDAPDEAYKLALVTAVSNTLKKGLWLLGMPILEKM